MTILLSAADYRAALRLFVPSPVPARCNNGPMIRPRLLHALALAVVCWTISAPRAATLSFIPQSNGGIVGIGSDIGCGTALSETLESAFARLFVINRCSPPDRGEF